MIFNVPAILAQLDKISCFKITVFKTIMVLMPFRGLYYMSKEAEVVTKGEEGILMNFVFPFLIKIREDSTVLPQ